MIWLIIMLLFPGGVERNTNGYGISRQPRENTHIVRIIHKTTRKSIKSGLGRDIK